MRAVLDIPLTVGGGVRSVEDAARLLNAGADKVAVNSAAMREPSLINQLAAAFGSQCTVLAIDAASSGDGSWEVVTVSGTTRTGVDVLGWAREGACRGAGELLLTSWDRDGTRDGYDCRLIRAVSDACNLPIIASGGANGAAHMVDALEAGASAVLAASIFHTRETSVTTIKQALQREGVEVRL